MSVQSQTIGEAQKTVSATIDFEKGVSVDEWAIGDSIVPAIIQRTAWWKTKRSHFHLGATGNLLPLLIMAFFLGRATIVTELSPFSIALFSAVSRLKPKAAVAVAVLSVVGAATGSRGWQGCVLTAINLLLYRIITKLLEQQKAVSSGVVPFVAFLVASGTRMGQSVFAGDLTRYTVVMSLVEGFLALVLTMILLQSLPIFTFARGVKRLRTEEIICLVILLASVLTGFSGMTVAHVALENIFSRYLIMLLAAIGGAGIGGGVGVVTGIILSMGNLSATSQIGLLAFSGVLGGLLKDAKKLGVGIGFLLGTAILTVYVSQLQSVWIGVVETVVAFVLLLVTPRSMIDGIARYVPGTHQHTLSQHEYARRARELMAGRIREVSSVFQELSNTFNQIQSTQLLDDEEAAANTLRSVADQVCVNCRKQAQCWGHELQNTSRALFETMSFMDNRGPIPVKEVPAGLKRQCIRLDVMVPTLYTIMDMAKRDLDWQQRMRDNRSLVTGQLAGVSRIMGDLAREITRENHTAAEHEESIMGALEQLGLSVQEVDILSLDEGRVEIEVTQPNYDTSEASVKVIAPLLSEIVGENITMVERTCDERAGTCKALFRSARAYQVVAGFAYAAKDGISPSGDSYTALDVGNGKYAIAVSDGMGNGERAMQESSAAIRLVQQLLKAGFDEELAIRTVNSALLLRSQDEMFATMDLALIDLFSARAEFMKIGSVPSLIKRRGEVLSVRAANVPIGILQDIDIQTVEEQLREGDLLVMVSDGIFDAPKHVYDKEDWLRRQLLKMETEDPQDIADLLLEAAVRVNQGKIVDDMTIVVAKIEAFHPQWAKIRVPGVHPIKRRASTLDEQPAGI